MDKKYIILGLGAVCSLAVVGNFLRTKSITPPQFKEPSTSFKFSVSPNHRKITMVIPVTTTEMQKIRLKIWDKDNPKTYYTDRYMTFNGLCAFQVMMPVTPKNLMVSVYAENGKAPFTIGQIREEPLKQKLEFVNIMSPSVHKFIKFAQNFAFNASYLDVGQTYMSDDKQFFIEYLPVITNENGQPMNTSARINNVTGTLQVSKRDFDLYTVPMRMAVLLHEFSHFNLNENIHDESEADLNGLLIYLGLGYPRVEALEAWAEVFEGAKTRQNSERFKLIQQFIADFEDNKIGIAA